MKVKIYTEKEFERQLRKLSKKYRSMLDDYDAFLTGLEQDPFQGSSLGKGVRKVRMAIASKGKGKSGGVRVIYYHVTSAHQIRMILIYRKGIMDSLTDKQNAQLRALNKGWK